MKPASIAPRRAESSAHQPRMRRARLSALGLAIALTVGTAPAAAAGLGRLSLLSGIGQPLRAEIELTSIGREESGSLSARLASPDAYGQAGIEYGGPLSTLRFSIQRRTSGQPYVLVTSTQAVNDTFLDMLVELTWGSGRLVREYTMLLDPPETRTARAEVDPGQTVVAAQSPAVAPRRARVPATDRPQAASDAATTAAAAPRRSTPAASTSGTGADYVVQNGDTAFSISRANKPEGTSLEQMLAAVYRDNPQAFAGNVNRLMAGATLKLPDAATSQAISTADAGRIVAQTGNFGRYRDRLAQAAGEAPAARAAAPQTSGKLTPAVQDNATPANENRDRLQLSRPDAAAKTGTAAGAAAVRSGVGGPSAEEVAAKDRELAETRSRLAQLQKNVTDLQDLLKLKNQTLADLQKGTPTKAGETPAAATPAVAAVTPSAPVTPALATAPPLAPSASTVLTSTPPVAATPAATPPAAAPVVAPPVATDAAPTPAPAVVKPAPPPASVAPTTPQGAWYEDLLGNSMALLGLGLLVLLLIGYGVYTVLRRRKLAHFEDSIFVDNSVLHANSVFGTTGGQSVDTANSGFHSNFVPAGGGLPEQNEVDPVAEADVYIAYGREAQAEEILKEALRADGTRHAVRQKLLEIYARRGDTKTFETLATELYAATGGQGNDWSQAAQLGLTIDPRNPLYSQTGAPAAPVAANIAAAPPPAAPSFAAEPMPSAALASGLGRNVPEAAPAPAADHTRTEPMARAAPPAAESSMDLDFDLGVGGQRPAPLSAVTTAAAPAPAPVAPDFDAHEPTKSLVEPFTASAFGATEIATRTAVNLPAFRARADPPAAPTPSKSHTETDGFSASDIFGSSIVADADAYTETPRTTPPTSARSSDFRPDLNHQDFAKTEPYDAFSKINLELDHQDFAAPGAHSEIGDKTEVWQAMATKLDLALAYSDIGDKDGARELLDEVVRNGDDTQAERAKHLITQLD